MKFTEGYWLRSENSNAIYAAQAYDVYAIEGGMRVVAPVNIINSRGDTLNLPTLTIEFTSPEKDVIAVKSYHYEAFESHEATFEKFTNEQAVKVTITDNEAIMETGNLLVRVNRNHWGYTFEAEGKVITSCGFRNLGYMKADREPSTMLPQQNYMKEVHNPYMVTELSLQPGECVYGFGERFTAFVKNGQCVETWNEDGGTSSQIAYKSIPFYMTNKGYGIFVDHTDHVSFEVASEKVEYVGFSVPGEELRYLFIYGPKPKDILQSYTTLTGKPALPPAWSFGLWLSTSFTTNYDESTTSSFIDGMLERNIPLSVFHFDCFWMKEFQWCDLEWDQRVFPDIKGMLNRYKNKGLKIDVWINPYVAQGTKLFREGKEQGYFLKRADGKGVKQIDWWQPGMALIDFTNPEACRWFEDKLEALLEMGVDCFKTDFGERIPIDVTYYDGSNAKSMHNYYTFLYNQCVFNLLKSVRGEGEAVVFARSATTGSQQFPIHWGGDSSASYPSMAETLRGGLSLSLSGFAFWSHDISGFELTATPDLYKRWVAFGMLSSHSRLHGSTSYRVPWLFDEESSDVVRYFTQLKCSLMPYIYKMAILAKEEGTPLLRPMVFEFQEDPAVAYLDQQYMFGESLLVAPIFNAEGQVSYYLPEGRWTNYFTEEVKEGGRYYKGTYDYMSLPFYVRPNTLLAIGSNNERPDYDYSQGVTFHLYELEEGHESMCEVPDVKGKIKLIARASKENGSIYIQFSEEPIGVKVVIHGAEGLVSVEGATIIEVGKFLMIEPIGKNVKVHL